MIQGEIDGSDPWVGRVIGDRYKVVRSLGRGGMGKVFLADQRMGTAIRKVALKALHPDLASEPSIAVRFNREAETVIKLSHPNTITFYDFGQSEDGTLYIVMEYIEGVSLARLVEKGPIEPERIENILSQICASLHEAHDLGIIHRDLKPENVILTERASQKDFVKLLDFGIAKRTELDTDSLQLTRAGVVLGTPPYMSPEQFAGQRLDPRSDVYSLGVMGYEMLTGRLPFTAKTPWEWATQHLSIAPPPIPDVIEGREIPERFRRTILRALAKEVDDRPSSVKKLLAELRGEIVVETAPPLNSDPLYGDEPDVGSRVDTRIDTLISTEIPQRKPRWLLWLVIVSLILLIPLLVGGAFAAIFYGLIPNPLPAWLPSMS